MPTIHHWSQTHLPVDQSTDSTSTSGAAGDPAQQPWSPAPEGRYEYASRTEAMQEIVKSEVRSRCTLFLMLFFKNVFLMHCSETGARAYGQDHAFEAHRLEMPSKNKGESPMPIACFIRYSRKKKVG